MKREEMVARCMEWFLCEIESDGEEFSDEVREEAIARITKQEVIDLCYSWMIGEEGIRQSDWSVLCDIKGLDEDRVREEALKRA